MVRRKRRRIRDGVAMVVELCNEYCGRVLLYLSVLGEITRGKKKSCSASIHILSLRRVDAHEGRMLGFAPSTLRL
jgi:hypothetical protein